MAAALIRAVVVIVTIAALPAAMSFADQNADDHEAVVLVTAYADGRLAHHVVTKTSRQSWTPYFPKLSSAPPSDRELPVQAIGYRRVLTNDGNVQVTISVLRGHGHEAEEPVATVVVKPGDQVTIEELRAFGVMPVTFSLTTLGRATLLQPKVVNRTAGLEVVDVAVTDDAGGRYRITIKNLASQPAVSFHFVARREDRNGMMGNRGNMDSTPIIEPGDSYTFSLDPGREDGPAGEIALVPHDVIEIVAVLWEDGTTEGDPGPMASALAVYLARAAQLKRGVRILTTRSAQNGKGLRDSLRAQLAALPTIPDAALMSQLDERLRRIGNVDTPNIAVTMQMALAAVRRGMIEDLDGAPRDDRAFEHWLQQIALTYSSQAQRFERR